MSIIDDAKPAMMVDSPASSKTAVTGMRPLSRHNVGNRANALVLLFSLYSQPAFYTGYIVHPSTLLIPTRKWILSQQHRRIQVDEAETAQASHKMGGGRDSQPRFHHRPYHQWRNTT